MIVKSILVCEDIRQEVGNKLSLMGVLGSSLNVEVPKEVPKDTPISISLACLISIENTNIANDIRDFSVQVVMSLGEKKLFNIAAKIQSTDIERIYHLPVQKFEFLVTKSTGLSICTQVMKNGVFASEYTAILDININRSAEPQTK